MKGQFKIIVIFTLSFYLLVLFAANLAQHHVIFRSSDLSFAPPKKFDVEEVYINTPDGQKLYAWWFQTERAEKTILFFQGNGRNISHHKSHPAVFKALGANALMLDYRGYGKSTGRIKQEHDIHIDGASAWNYLVNEKKIPPEKIIIWGRSLGGGVAVETASGKDVGALVLESTFYSMDEMARRRYWYLPTQLFLKFHFTSGEKLTRIKSPVIIIHSVGDSYIPFSHATRLYAAANQPKTLIKTKGSYFDQFDVNKQDLGILKKHLEL